MSEKALKFGDTVINKKEFHSSKQAIALNSVKTGKILVSYKFEHSYDGFKYFIGYLHDDNVIRPLCITFPQMSGYIKYFDNGGKNMSFKIEDESAYLKYTEIWNKIKNSPNSKFYSMMNTLFSCNEILKEENHYICIAAICVDSVLRVDEKNLLRTVLI